MGNIIRSHYLFYVAALYMFWAANGNFDFDYGFYQLLRFVAFFAFGFAAYISHKKEQQIVPFVLGFLAIVFNPFMPIYFERETWQWVDVVGGLVLLTWSLVSFEKKFIILDRKSVV